MRSLLVLFVAAFVGCGGGDETLPAALSGVFHTDAVDAVNLRIDDDGTFQWKIYGCDFGAVVDGVWTRDGDRVVLRSNNGAPLQWLNGGSFQYQIDHVEVSSVDGELQAVGKSATDDTLFTQTWPTGGVCVACGGPLGPTGQCACGDPFGNPSCP